MRAFGHAGPRCATRRDPQRGKLNIGLDAAHAGVRIHRVRKPAQLPLYLPIAQRYAATDFCESPSNEQAVQWLARTADWPDLRLALWGQAGCGKTHLLHVWAARTGGDVLQGSDLGSILEQPPARPIALDAADAVPDETALFHLLNAAGEARLPVLLASRQPAARWGVRLPDLASRLRAITAVEIRAPDDELLRSLLVRLIAAHQLPVTQPVHDWLLRRLPRTAGALREAMARLDSASLAAHRPITVPLARETLADMLAASDDEISGS